MTEGLARGLTSYGDRDFALSLRRSVAKSMGYSGAGACRRPVNPWARAPRRVLPAPALVGYPRRGG